MTFHDGQPTGRETEPGLLAPLPDADAGVNSVALPQSVLDPGQSEARRIMIMRRRLGAIANNPLDDIVLGMMLRDFGWEYKKEAGNPPVYYLTKRVMDSSIELELPERPTPARSLHRDEDGLTIRVKDTTLRGRDGVTLLDIQARYSDYLRKRESKLELGEFSWSTASARFEASQGVYLREGDPLKDLEAVALSCMTHAGTLGELSAGLGISQKELRGVLKPLYDRLGLQSGSSSPDSYMDLMLAAIALEEANVKHVSLAPESKVQALKGTAEGEVLALYYSPDPQERDKLRARYTQHYIGTTWSKLFGTIEIPLKRRHDAVLYGVRNKVLLLPDASLIKEKLTQGRTSTEPAHQ